MLTCKNDFVKAAGVSFIDGKAYVSLNGRDYRLKKSAYAMNYSPVHVSDSMTGKMENVVSISTSCLCNPICRARVAEGKSICAHCFADAILQGAKRRRKALVDAMESNFHLLTESVLPLDLLPVFPNISILRIESFGDVANVTQAINYANIARVNPSVTVAWWSKNLNFLRQAFDAIGGKPANVIVIQSSFFVNTPAERDPVADKVFTVYDPEFAAAHDIDINCGARSCATCRRCYSHDTGADVREMLK